MRPVSFAASDSNAYTRYDEHDGPAPTAPAAGCAPHCRDPRGRADPPPTGRCGSPSIITLRTPFQPALTHRPVRARAGELVFRDPQRRSCPRAGDAAAAPSPR
jgi:hypothetical protein